MDDLITVILNMYNAEKYAKKCLDSIVAQTYKNLEILIINDGSIDNTLEICNSYSDERIKIISQENKGLSISRNVGIDNAKGEYLFFVDSDDFIENDTIEYLYKLSKKHNADISTCNPLDIYNYNFSVKCPKEEINIISQTDMLKKVFLTENRAGTIWNKLIKKELFNNIRFENRIINDVVVVYKLILASKKIVYSNQIKYFYLHHNESITSKKTSEHSIDLYKASEERYKYIKNIYPDFIENEICVMTVIINLFLNEKEKLQEFLREEKALKKYNELFSFRILLKSSMNLKGKLKLVLFRINPYFYRWIVKIYLKLK